MKYLLSIALLAALLLAAVPIQAADPCDPAKVITQANALKSSGDEQKDLTALTSLKDKIVAMQFNCTDAEVGKRIKPVPLGETYLAANGDSRFELTVKKVVRGAAALKMMKTASSINGDPPAGKEYLLVLMNIKYTEGSEDQPYTIIFHDFFTYSKGSLDKDLLFVSPPEPGFDFEIFPGFEGEGWIPKYVPANDPNPSIGVGSIYFAAYE